MCICIVIYFKELAHMIIALSSPKYIGLEIQPRVEIAALTLKSVGQVSRLGTQARFLHSSITAESLPFQESSWSVLIDQVPPSF